jgi:ketosteroid isomerase-like protein
MDHSTTQRRLYDLLNAGDIDGFGALLADDFVEHEETPGLAPTKDGVLEFFRMYRSAFPNLRMDAEDVLPSGDKVVARVRATPSRSPRARSGPVHTTTNRSRHALACPQTALQRADHQPARCTAGPYHSPRRHTNHRVTTQRLT